jgi:hypothetical protein
MSSLSVAEILDKVKTAKTNNERIDILVKNDCSALRGILRLNYDKSLSLALPEGAPPYKKNKNPDGFGDTTLKASSRGWYVFVKELSPKIKQSKRESLFIELLEQLDSKESEILIHAKDKKLDIGLTRKVINEAFPGLIKDEVIDSDVEKERKSAKKSGRKKTKGDGESV